MLQNTVSDYRVVLVLLVKFCGVSIHAAHGFFGLISKVFNWIFVLLFCSLVYQFQWSRN